MAGLPTDNSSPTVEIELYGILGRPNPPVVFNAILDTGFTGGVSIPIMQALPLGLVLLSTAKFTLADGSIEETYICGGIARLAGVEHPIAFSLSRGSNILVGTEFLSTFNAKLEIDYKTKTFSMVAQPLV